MAALCVVCRAPAGDTISFEKSTLVGLDDFGIELNRPTSLQFGPDGRLYVGVQSGTIYAFSIRRTAPNAYEAIDVETIDIVRHIPNHDDDGTPNPTIERLLTGLLVTGAPEAPVIYATSSDWRTAAGVDTGLDTNSGVLSRLAWTGAQWEHVMLVSGLPRSEENHGANGMALDPTGTRLYLAVGGNTNMGAPSVLFGELPEYALSAAILDIDLLALGDAPYILPTLDDPTRANRNGADIGDPWGGNDGLNQAIIEPGGPVQIHAPGFRNAYDLVLTDAGRLYTVDNGANLAWGGPPSGEAVCTNDINEDGTQTVPDALHFIDGPGYYGGHPNPTRGSAQNTFGKQSPIDVENPIECESFLPPFNGSLASWSGSVNGLCEYTAGNFGGQMNGDLLAIAWNQNALMRVALSDDGTVAVLSETLFTNVGAAPLDVTAPRAASGFPGTIWVCDYALDAIVIYEPVDGFQCTADDDPFIDEDGDGYSNADELDAGSNPCSAGSVPSDFDGDGVSDVNDPDDDDDGIDDRDDPFALDAANGLATVPPIDYGWALGEPGHGLFGLGFTGTMTNGFDDYLDVIDPDGATPGGAAGKLTIDAIPAGDALGTLNTQAWGLQFGVNVTETSPSVRIATVLEGPFLGMPPSGAQSVGLFIGSGTQDDFVRAAIAHDGAGGLQIEVTHEANGVPTITVTPRADLATAARVELAFIVDPLHATVIPQYAIDGGPPRAAAPALDLDGALRDAVQFTPALAVGIIATSRDATPFPATWDGITVEPIDDGVRAAVRVDPPGNDLNGSTFTPGSFVIMNPVDAPTRIVSVTFDLTSALLPDLVFDPDGLAGDTTAKDFTPDAGAAATGLAGHRFDGPHDDGFDRLTIDFDDFDSGESFAFSIDVDPTSVRGSAAPGPSSSASVSGLELTGAQVLILDDAGTMVALRLAADGTALDAAHAARENAPTAAPGLDWSSGEPFLVTTAPTALLDITGPPDATVRVTRLEAALFTEGVPGGGFDLDPFESNSIIARHVIDVPMNGASMRTIDVPLSRTNPAGGFNHVTAAILDGDGREGPPSVSRFAERRAEPLVGVPPSLQFPTTALDTMEQRTVTLLRNAARSITIESIELTGSAAFDFVESIPLPLVLSGENNELDVPLHFIPVVEGVASAELVVEFDDIGSPLRIPIAGLGVNDAEFANVQYRINCGGPELPALDDGIPWAEDQAETGAAGGTAEYGEPSPYVNDASTHTFGTATPVTIGGSVPQTAPPALFQSERWDPASPPEMTYALPVTPNAAYEVRLSFAEIVSGFDEPGDRVFDVTIDGVLVFDDIDPVAFAGAYAGFTRSTLVIAADDVLDITFHHVAQHPAVKAIEIVRLPPACPTDLDGDDVTGFGDLLLLLAEWGATDAPIADLDDDGTVGFTDLVVLLGAWGAC